MQGIDADRLAEAVRLAATLHAGQKRKGREIPYVAHLLAVSGLVLEHGGDSDSAIAGLLHDALEDAEGITVADLRARFGERVARMIADCTDTAPGDRPGAKSPWEERKRRYLERLESTPEESLLVAACDKRHNLGALVADLRAEGSATLGRFRAAPERQVWYYEEFLRRAGGRVPERLRRELEDLVRELAVLAGARVVE